jgi:hypothetical protein
VALMLAIGVFALNLILAAAPTVQSAQTQVI